MVCLVAALAGATSGFPSLAEEGEEPGWSNSTELNVLVTEGNSKTETLGLKSTFKWRWEKSSFQLKLDGARSDTSDDRYLQVEPGFTWEPGADPPEDYTTSVFDPGAEPDVEKYFIEGQYSKIIAKRRTWHAGGSWDRNKDAGILSRYIAFGGVGHIWKDKDDFRFSTTYGLSFTDREEEEPDPRKEDRFAGIRLSWEFLDKFGKVTTYENVFTGNLNLKDASDFSLDMTNSLSVAMSRHLALKVSLQWLHNSEPALEDVDIFALIQIVDPTPEDPGSGDEYFETVDSDGDEIFTVEVGEGRTRKRELDTIFTTGLVITF